MQIICRCGTKLQISGPKDGMRVTFRQCGKTLSIKLRKQAESAVSRLDDIAATEGEIGDGLDSVELPRLTATRTVAAGKKQGRLRFRKGIAQSMRTGITSAVTRAVTRPFMLLREFGWPLLLLLIVGAGGWYWTVFRDSRADQAKAYQSLADRLGEAARGTPKEPIDQPYIRPNVVVIEQHSEGYHQLNSTSFRRCLRHILLHVVERSNGPVSCSQTPQSNRHAVCLAVGFANRYQ